MQKKATVTGTVTYRQNKALLSIYVVPAFPPAKGQPERKGFYLWYTITLRKNAAKYTRMRTCSRNKIDGLQHNIEKFAAFERIKGNFTLPPHLYRPDCFEIVQLVRHGGLIDSQT